MKQSIKNFIKSVEFIILLVGFFCAQISLIGIGPKAWFAITLITYSIYNLPKVWSWIKRNLNIGQKQ